MAKDKIANLGAYLHKEYGDDILQSLPADTQRAISKVTWDPETDRLLSKLDRELDDILEDGASLEFVDISLITSPSSECPASIAPSNTFVPRLDTDSVSTFGTVALGQKRFSAVSLGSPASAE